MFLRQHASARKPAPVPEEEAPPLIQQRRGAAGIAGALRPLEPTRLTAEPAPLMAELDAPALARPALEPMSPAVEPPRAPPLSSPPAVVAPAGGRATVAEDGGGKRLIVGDSIRLKGEITACDRLIVEGHVEVTLNETRALEIRPSGRFIGSCEVEEAEIGGAFQGELTVRGRLVVRAGGEITGKIRYGELELERGARIAGELSVHDPAGPSPLPAAEEPVRSGDNAA